MPGSTSPAGRTSISTGSAPVIRLTASALAACPPLTATPFLRRKVSPQPQVPGLFPFGDDGVVFLPFGALVFGVRGVQVIAEHAPDEVDLFERGDRLAERPGQPPRALGSQVPL